jgi:outer membrane receptor for ferrienterochelin and colicin
MRRFFGGSAGALLLAALGPALCQEQVTAVTVTGSAADRLSQSSAIATVIKHDDLLRQGDATLADALKRQPGITLDGAPGKPATLRLRGMGSGYAAILMNGLLAPNGFNLESLDPNVVERVEILRAGTAETSGQAIAGSINIVLRRAGAGADEIKAGAASGDGYFAPSLVAQRTVRRGSLAFTLAATARRERTPVSAVFTETGVDAPLLRRTAAVELITEDMLELAPRLSWQPDPQDAFSAQAYVRRRRVVDDGGETEATLAGGPTRFPRARHRYGALPRDAFGEAGWNRRLDGGARLALKLSAYATTRVADFDWLGMAADGAPLETHRVASGPAEREWIVNGSWRRPLAGGHLLAAGWEFGSKRRDEYRRETQRDARAGSAGAVLLSSDASYAATVRRAAWYVQDEWAFGPSRSIYIGLRREDLHTGGAGNADAAVDVRAGAWSPIVQALFERDAANGAHDAWRLALSRTYRAPGIVQLMPRRYTVDNGNSVVNPDQQGNPALKPELALGVDLAWERRMGAGTSFGAGIFAKRIRDVILDRIAQSASAWVATPDNQGTAHVRGLELEGRTAFGALAAHGNLARNWSRLEAVPGPDNRIDGQPRASASLGLDYAASGAVELGASWTWRGGVASRRSATLAAYGGAKRQLDVYATVKGGAGRLRLSAANLLHGGYADSVVYTGDGGKARSVAYRTHAVWRVMWERNL